MRAEYCYLLGTAFFCAFSLPIAVIDIRTLRIPNRLIYPAIATVLGWFAFSIPDFFVSSLVAGVFAVLVFLLIRRVTGSLGFGDVKYAALLGSVSGVRGLPLALFAAAASGLAYAAYAILVKKQSIKTRIPFAPFLFIGGLSAAAQELARGA